jgi:hypothetical protein
VVNAGPTLRRPPSRVAVSRFNRLLDRRHGLQDLARPRMKVAAGIAGALVVAVTLWFWMQWEASRR